MILRFFILLSVVLLFWVKPLSSQPLFELGEWYFESFDELEDPGVDVINTMIQDEQGFIWMGSQNGLLRYDGYEFLQFLPDLDDRNSLAGKYVKTLLEINGKL